MTGKRFTNLYKKRLGSIKKMIALLLVVVIAVAVIPTMATPVSGAEVLLIFAPDCPEASEYETNDYDDGYKVDKTTEEPIGVVLSRTVFKTEKAHKQRLVKRLAYGLCCVSAVGYLFLVSCA
ncbi:MAG: hypothetical protein FWC92_11745 [Defluviitaleaceae bacterium]|nr:hypothetical protein [Defluviitaleaceae bacterium]